MSVSSEQIAAAKARLVEIVGADVALKRNGRDFIGLCPVHAEKTPSFHVYADGHAHCFGCGAHFDAISYVMRQRNLGFADAVREIINAPAPTQRRDNQASAPRSAAVTRQSDIARAIWAEAKPITERTAAWLYFHSRGFRPSKLPPTLRAHATLYCHEVGRPLPAVVAALQDSSGRVTAVQRIWVQDRVEIDPNKPAQHSGAKLTARKKTLGEMRDGAVRLVAAEGSTLGLAEGIETALAAQRLFMLPVWAVCGGARLATVWLPDTVTNVLIFGDAGDTGRALAERAVAAHGERGCSAASVFPRAGFSDFADQLIGVRA